MNYDTATFNAWGWNAGCDFATASCAALAANHASSAFTCDINDAAAERACTADHLATGACTVDSKETYDGCPRVLEFGNGGCAGPDAIVPGVDDQISGWYKGPFSRCIQQSDRFGRNGYRYASTPGGLSACYRMACIDNQLHVVIDGTSIPCPEGRLITLDDYPGARPRHCCRIATATAWRVWTATATAWLVWTATATAWRVVTTSCTSSLNGTSIPCPEGCLIALDYPGARPRHCCRIATATAWRVLTTTATAWLVWTATATAWRAVTTSSTSSLMERASRVQRGA